MTSDSGQKRSSEEAFRRRRRLGRECAMQFLYHADVLGSWDCDEATLACFWRETEELREGCAEGPSDRDRGFSELLIRGVCCRRDELDELIERSTHNWTLARMAAVDRNILRLAALQLFHCDDVPDLTAVDEAIEMAKTFGNHDSSRFINGVLDSLLRQRRGETE